MKLLLSQAALFLFWLVSGTDAIATTAVRTPNSQTKVETQKIVPRDTQRAGQDIELRKVQAMLSRQGPPPAKKSDPRR